MKKDVIILSDIDNVAVVMHVVNQGESVRLPDGKVIMAIEKVPAFHKIAIVSIPKHSPVLRYGAEIGYALTDIQAGAWVHVHNLDAVDIM